MNEEYPFIRASSIELVLLHYCKENAWYPALYADLVCVDRSGITLACKHTTTDGLKRHILAKCQPSNR